MAGPSRRARGDMYDLTGKRIYVAGHTGMVGSAIVRALQARGLDAVWPAERLDLRDQAAARGFVAAQRPQVLILAAAKVGGILANSALPASFLYDNLMIEANLIQAAHETGVEKLLFLGSSCIYPKMAPQPIVEEALLTGPLEPTNAWYAVAKIAGIKLCEAYRTQYGASFISAMPTNLYGPNDNFDLASSHVLPALMRRMHEAKLSGAPSVTLWGTGAPRREFMHVDDLADACLHLLQVYDAAPHVNVGVGEDLTIRDLAEKIAAVVGYQGLLEQDPSKPDGTPRKLMDSRRLTALGWRPSISLDDGLRRTYDWFLAQAGAVRGAA